MRGLPVETPVVGAELNLSPTNELITTELVLFNDPEYGGAWTDWAGQYDDVSGLWDDLGVTGGPEAPEQLHLLEHNAYVGAVALAVAEATFGEIASNVGTRIIDPSEAIRAGFVHDAGIPHNISVGMSREDEADGGDNAVVNAMLARDIEPNVIAAALNTGRLYDRFLNPEETHANIVNRPPLANLVGYADARTIDATVVSLEEARAQHAIRKTDEMSRAFFAEDGPWINYYREVEAYLQFVNPSFDPESISHASVLETVLQRLEAVNISMVEWEKTEEMFKIEVFSAGKNSLKNEDTVVSNETTIVLCDGATDKTKLRFSGRTGGEIASRIVTEAALTSDLTGTELVSFVTEQLRNFYREHNSEALDDSAYRSATSMVAARIVGDNLVVTQVGDSSFRINGTDEYTNSKEVDQINATTRAQYIVDTGDVEGSRDVILPALEKQHILQNNPDNEHGYGVIDGTEVPESFVRVHNFPIANIHTLELVSDGYYDAFPDKPTIKAYEELRAYIEEVDPHKSGEFASTKVNDDRTVAIIHILQETTQ